MPFVIIDAEGKPLSDIANEVIVLCTRDEARSWLVRGEWVEPYIPARHAINSNTGKPKND